MTDITIRPIQKSEYPVLEDFLYRAIFLPPGAEPPPRAIIFEPEIFVYIQDFGSKPEDFCVVAVKPDGGIVGAAWARVIPAYGHLDNETPELAISVLGEYRGKGVGTKLLLALFKILRGNGFTKTSLSVQTDNPAARLYKRLGYRVVSERPDHAGHTDYLMIKDLAERTEK